MKRIVIIDDSIVSGLLLQHLVNRVPGVRATAFQDPVDCLAACAIIPCDLAIVDYKMPKIDGLTFVGALHLLPRQEETPVIMVSGEPGVRDRALNAGVAAALGKPVEPAFLQETIARMLGLDRPPRTMVAAEPVRLAC